jgi:hypothetical protein
MTFDSERDAPIENEDAERAVHDNPETTTAPRSHEAGAQHEKDNLCSPTIPPAPSPG